MSAVVPLLPEDVFLSELLSLRPRDLPLDASAVYSRGVRHFRCPRDPPPEWRCSAWHSLSAFVGMLKRCSAITTTSPRSLRITRFNPMHELLARVCRLQRLLPQSDDIASNNSPLIHYVKVVKARGPTETSLFTSIEQLVRREEDAVSDIVPAGMILHRWASKVVRRCWRSFENATAMGHGSTDDLRGQLMALVSSGEIRPAGSSPSADFSLHRSVMRLLFTEHMIVCREQHSLCSGRPQVHNGPCGPAVLPLIRCTIRQGVRRRSTCQNSVDSTIANLLMYIDASEADIASTVRRSLHCTAFWKASCGGRVRLLVVSGDVRGGLASCLLRCFGIGRDRICFRIERIRPKRLLWKRRSVCCRNVSRTVHLGSPTTHESSKVVLIRSSRAFRLLPSAVTGPVQEIRTAGVGSRRTNVADTPPMSAIDETHSSHIVALHAWEEMRLAAAVTVAPNDGRISVPQASARQRDHQTVAAPRATPRNHHPRGRGRGRPVSPSSAAASTPATAAAAAPTVDASAASAGVRRAHNSVTPHADRGRGRGRRGRSRGG